jgi:predicted unusual protein kinase regulating ubiquinone biosynthesis (AarF/ABC1/UbiB family)
VVIKVIRPDILPIIKADMKLIYRLARWVPRLLPDGRRLRPQEVVREYEKTLIDELNLLRESANAIQLRRNFENSPMLYVPEVYSDYCSQNMMVMERIYGIPVSDGGAGEAGNEHEAAGRAWRAGLLHPGVPRQLLPCGHASGQYFCQLRASGRSAVHRY